MYLILCVIGAFLIFILEGQRDKAKINERDNDPNNSIKTNKWHEEHDSL